MSKRIRYICFGLFLGMNLAITLRLSLYWYIDKLKLIVISNLYSPFLIPLNGTCFRTTSTKSLCRIFSVCIFRWEHWRFLYVLLKRSSVTITGFYNNMYHIRALRHILYWEIESSYVPWVIRGVKCFHGVVWGICKR